MARKPAPVPETPIDTGRGPVRSLAVAVAIEAANAAVNAPTPPEIQAILDADPAATAEAREALAAVIGSADATTPETQSAASAEPQE